MPVVRTALMAGDVMGTLCRIGRSLSDGSGHVDPVRIRLIAVTARGILPA
jgi:hypothetical protein